MKLKMLLTVYAVLMAGPGAAYLVAPSGLMSLIGVQPLDYVEILLMRTIGALAIGVGVMCWTARTAEASKARDALILGLTVISGIFAVVAVLVAIDGRMVGGPWAMWTQAVFWVLFTVLFIVVGRRAMSAPRPNGGIPGVVGS